MGSKEGPSKEMEKEMFKALMEVMYDLKPDKPDYLKPPEMLSDKEWDELFEFMKSEAEEPDLTEEQEKELIKNSPHREALDLCVQNIADGLKDLNLKGQFIEDVLCVNFEGGALAGPKAEYILTVQHGAVGVVVTLILQKTYDWSMIDKFQETLIMEPIEGIRCNWDFDEGKPLARLVITDAYEDDKISNASRWVNKFVALYSAKLAEVDAAINNSEIS